MSEKEEEINAHKATQFLFFSLIRSYNLAKCVNETEKKN